MTEIIKNIEQEIFLIFAKGNFGQRCVFASSDLREVLAIFHESSLNWIEGASHYSIEGWKGKERREVLSRLCEEKYYIAIDKTDDIRGMSKNKKRLEVFHSVNKILECEKELFNFLEEHDFNPVWEYDVARKIAYISKIKKGNVWDRLPFLSQSFNEIPDKTNEETCNYCGQNYSNHSEKLCSGT